MSELDREDADINIHRVSELDREDVYIDICYSCIRLVHELDKKGIDSLIFVWFVSICHVLRQLY